MKEYIIYANIHIRSCVWADSKESLFDIVERILDGEYDGIVEILDVDGSMSPTGNEDVDNEV